MENVGLKNHTNNDYCYAYALSDSYKADSLLALPSSHTIFIAWFMFYPEDGNRKFLRNGGNIYQTHGVTRRNTVMSILSLLWPVVSFCWNTVSCL
jgi:hypothetical protein